MTRERLFCFTTVLLGLALKLALIQQSEIRDDFHDSSEYVLQILYPLNGGLGYGPGTGFLGRIFYDVGLPFRWGIEVGYLLAIAFVLRSLFDWPGKTWLPTGLFLVAAFDPAVMELFSKIWSDQVWMIATLLGFAWTILAVEKPGTPSWPLMLGAALTLGFSCVTRTVIFPLTLAVLAVFVCGVGSLLLKRNRAGAGPCAGQFALAGWSVLLGIGIVHFGVCTYHLKKFDFYGTCVPDSAEYKSFYLCLQSVGDPSGPPHFPIDAHRRELIAQAGPTARWLMQQLDHDAVDNEGGKSQYGLYDIPGGLFHWAVFHSTWVASAGDLRKTFDILSQVEREIDRARQSRTIPTHPIIPLPDARLNVVAKYYSESLAATAENIVYEPRPDFRYTGGNPTDFRSRDFDLALHRRPVRASPWREQIWQCLGVIYTYFYKALGLAAFPIFFGALAINWMNGRCSASLEEVPLFFRQLYVALFVSLLAWYALFAEAGVHPDTRYMIFNHVMLPILLAYYLAQTRELAAKKGLLKASRFSTRGFSTVK